MLFHDVLSSPAWRALPLAARKVLDRLMVEHMNHGGSGNGSLICTYTDFEEFGVRRASVKTALQILQALGFIEVTNTGRRSAAQFRNPNRFRLTFVAGNLEPTHEWRRVKDDAHAASILASYMAKGRK